MLVGSQVHSGAQAQWMGQAIHSIMVFHVLQPCYDSIYNPVPWQIHHSQAWEDVEEPDIHGAAAEIMHNNSWFQLIVGRNQGTLADDHKCRHTVCRTAREDVLVVHLRRQRCGANLGRLWPCCWWCTWLQHAATAQRKCTKLRWLQVEIASMEVLNGS